MRKRFFLGFDPAQLFDFAALSALEVTYEPGQDAVYRLVNLERKQRVSYPDLVTWVVDALSTPAFREGASEPPEIVLDSTGVGIAVRDMIRQKNMPLVSIMTTAGNSMNRDRDGYRVGKARIYGKFFTAFDNGRVHINEQHPHFEQLLKELKAFKSKLSTAGNALFEADVGEHDDMITSLALPVWYFEEFKPMGIPKLTFAGQTKTPVRIPGGASPSSNWVAQASDDMVRAHRRLSR
jgi:hypothetical protein